MSSAQWMAAQLAAMGRQQGLGLTVPRYNPRPPGVIHEGSATFAVLAWLRANPSRWFSHYELQRSTKRTKNSIDFALAYLRAQELVVVAADSGRNPRYLRYCYRPKE